MKRISLILILTALLSSCSSIDPDVDFKGKIDEDFLTTLSRGELPMSLQSLGNDSYHFARPYKNGKAYGEWENLMSGGWVGFSFEGIAVYNFNGCSWTGYLADVDDYNRTELEREVGYAWRDYQSIVDNHRWQMRKCTFEIDFQNKKVLIDDKWYDIESATEDKIVLSISGFMYGTVNDKLVPNYVTKDIYTCNKVVLPFAPEDVDTYESERDAMLAHIRIMREYGGDVWHHSLGQKIQLAKIEEVVVAGKWSVNDLTEEEREEIFGPSI